MIFYFSATGNSKYVAERIAKECNDRVCSIEDCELDISLSKNESFGLVTPVNWWELPILTREFLSNVKLKAENNNYVFLVVTYGTTPGCCGEDARRILAKKDVILDASFSIKMPDNWTPIFDLSNLEKVAMQNQDAEVSIDNVISKIQKRATGNQTEHKAPYFVRIFTDPLLNKERKTKNFYVEDSCIGCGLCAKKCPVDAIEIQDKKPVWIKEQCALCLGCLHRCPKFSIQYGNGKTKKHGQYRNPNTKI